MHDIFDLKQINKFTIFNFTINSPINILSLDNRYLSTHSYSNLIDFYPIDDNSDRQKWILERSDHNHDIYYIRLCFPRDDNLQYLGFSTDSYISKLFYEKAYHTEWFITNSNDNIYNIQNILFSKLANIINHCNLNFNFLLDTPINIKFNNNFLSSHPWENIIDFYGSDDDSGRQKWIIQRYDDKYIIRLLNEKFNIIEYIAVNLQYHYILTDNINFSTKFNINHLYDDVYNIAGEPLKYKVAIQLRGHERNTFKNDALLVFIKKIRQLFDVDLYIHTWNISEAKSSWRPLFDQPNDITEHTIRSYFNEVNDCIRCIIIDNDDHIPLNGNLNGIISNTQMPIIGWKKMWYGMYRLAEEVKNNHSDYNLVLNIRFDIFINHLTSQFLDLYNILKIVQNNINKDLSRLKFCRDYEIMGIDCLFIGNKYNIFDFCRHFNFDLDHIINNYDVPCQEFIVFREANK